jgi:hypothetical protein
MYYSGRYLHTICAPCRWLHWALRDIPEGEGHLKLSQGGEDRLCQLCGQPCGLRVLEQERQEA